MTPRRWEARAPRPRYSYSNDQAWAKYIIPHSATIASGAGPSNRLASLHTEGSLIYVMVRQSSNQALPMGEEVYG